MSICGTNSCDDFHGIGSPDAARNTDQVVMHARHAEADRQHHQRGQAGASAQAAPCQVEVVSEHVHGFQKGVAGRFFMSWAGGQA